MISGLVGDGNADVLNKSMIPLSE